MVSAEPAAFEGSWSIPSWRNKTGGGEGDHGTPTQVHCFGEIHNRKRVATVPETVTVCSDGQHWCDPIRSRPAWADTSVTCDCGGAVWS